MTLLAALVIVAFVAGAASAQDRLNIVHFTPISDTFSSLDPNLIPNGDQASFFIFNTDSGLIPMLGSSFIMLSMATRRWAA